MPNIGDSERKTQNRVVKFFKNKLHYTYLGNLHDRENGNIMPDLLRAWLLKRGYSGKLADNAIDALTKASTNLQQGLYHANKEVYSLLKYGAKVKETADQSPKTVYFIDFEDVLANDFYIAEEVTVVGNNTKRPDLVIYVNGIALAVIELKKSSVSVSNGIRQNLTNQKANFIEKFFTTMQFCMAGNDSEGLRYGTLLTPEKHYLEWKEDGFKEHPDERDTVDLEVEEFCRDIPVLRKATVHPEKHTK
jgi:type I restriction enzyme R subunit